MKLFWGAGSCAIGIHILLEEAGLTYETQQLDVAGGEAREAAFQAINPKGKVPTLVRDDGSVLTEFSAIATWIARQAPHVGLIPEDATQEARAVEVMAYVEGTIHGQGFARIFAPQVFEPQDAVHGKLGVGADSVRRQGRDIVERGFAILDPVLASHDFAAGDRFTIADAALFYVERWTPRQKIVLPDNVQRHYDRMLARPAIQKVRQAWGEA
ncbi:glutathione S-transferase family protein [Sphingomonas sp. PB4P5]|uniref:glutathione S-transferase family protein n=1 Tax=Parasphingomonas puruogangriensis TaxID=3096155 RepID=UPI002FC6E02F